MSFNEDPLDESTNIFWANTRINFYVNYFNAVFGIIAMNDCVKLSQVIIPEQETL